jgi:hypothetical protein
LAFWQQQGYASYGCSRLAQSPSNHLLTLLIYTNSLAKKSEFFVVKQVETHLDWLAIRLHLFPQVVFKFVGNDVAEGVVSGESRVDGL